MYNTNQDWFDKVLAKFAQLRGTIYPVAIYIRTSSKSTYNNTSQLRQLESINKFLFEKNLCSLDEYNIYSESCKDSTPFSSREQLSILISRIQSGLIKEVYVESFDRFSRNYDLLKVMKDLSLQYGVKIFSTNKSGELSSYSDKYLETYSSILLEEKQLLIIKLQSTKELNKDKKIYVPGRKNIYYTNFKDSHFLNLWEKEGLISLSLRKIQEILYNNNYKTQTGKPLALGTISKLKKYYFEQINK